MAARKARGGVPPPGSVATIEIEIERSREEGNWKRVVHLAEQLRGKQDSKQFETLSNFLIGEAKLEDFLEEFPPRDKNITASKEGLEEAREHLMRTIGEDAKKLGVHLDSYILLGKLNYAMGNYTEALKFYERAQLDSLEEKQLPARSLKIMAEAFAIKALCYEKVTAGRSTSKAKAAEREATIIRCYEVAGDLTLLFLQVADRTSQQIGQSTWSVASASTGGGGAPSSGPNPPSTSPVPPAQSSAHRLGPILEAALLKAPTLNLKAGQAMKAVNRFRAMLQAEESESTKEIRRNVCWKLAEVLLQGVSDNSYQRPDVTQSGTEASRIRGGNLATSTRAASSGALNNALTNDSPWKPRKHNGQNLYVPRSRLEEVVLLLLLGENMARKEAILSQAPEFFGMRSTKFRDAIITYDLCTVALARVRSYRVLCRMLQHSMKFSFNEPHTWTQYGLALAAEGRHHRALQVFRELAQRNQADSGVCLCAARICYERLHQYKEGEAWSERALKKDDSTQGRPLRGRCNIYLGLGHVLRVKTMDDHDVRKGLLEEAEKHFQKAIQCDPEDHLAQYYLAFHYATTRETAKAIRHVRKAMDLHPEHLGSMHLMVLLLSAQHEYGEALDLVEFALEEYPDNLQLMSLKVHLEERVNGGEAAILTAKGMLEHWQTACEMTASEESVVEAAGNQLMPGSSGGGGPPPLLMQHPLGGLVGSTAATMVGAAAHHQAVELNGLGVLSRGGAGAGTSTGIGGGAGGSQGGGGFDALSDKDSVSLHTHSMTASHVEKNLSEVASSLSSPFPLPGPYDPAYTQMRIWLVSAELHLRQRSPLEAEQCLSEARSLAPLSYHVMHVRGLTCEWRGDLDAARACYEASLGVNPSHVASLHRLGQVNHILGHHRSAEQSLKVAVRIDPTNEKLWTLLGEVKEAIGRESLIMLEEMNSPLAIKEEKERTPTEATAASVIDEATRMFRRAAECQAIAISLQASSPILPFTTIPLSFE